MSKLEEIREIELLPSYGQMIYSDSRERVLTEKLNRVIRYINILLKEKDK